MDKEDVKVLIHAGLAVIVIFGGFALIEIYGKSMITAGAIGAGKTKEIYCVQVSKVQHKGIEGRDNCCRMINQAQNCQMLDGTMELGYDYEKRTQKPLGYHKVEYACIDSSGSENRIYFNFDTKEYCELAGYEVKIEE
jgi:hypothetical protein